MSIGFDAGTYNLIACRRKNDKDTTMKREVNAFIEMPLENRFVFNMMKKAGVPLVEREEAQVAYALGEAAVDTAYTMGGIDLKRPMIHGCLNPSEKNAQQIMSYMIHGLIGKLDTDKQILFYSVPANAINDETDADYHQHVLQAIFDAFEDEKGQKLSAHPINEALALIYAELANKAFTGLGISCLVPGTKIYTDKGIQNIEDVVENSKVITHKGRWKNINKIVNKPFNGIMTKIQIFGYSDNVEDYKFVDNHELYVNRNNKWIWIGCNEIQIGDIVGEPVIQQNRDKRFQLTMTFCERKTNSKTTEKTKYEVSADVQRLIGYFLGDGSVNIQEGCVQFDFVSHEKQNINDVMDILEKNFKKYSSETKKSENCIRVKCYSKGMANYFKNHFYKNKEKHYPWDLKKLTKNHCLNLLTGLLRSDGYISDNSLNFYNTNTKLILLVKQLFSRLGVAASISYREPRSHILKSENRIIEGKKQEWTVQSSTKMTNQGLNQIISTINCKNSSNFEKTFIKNEFCCGFVQKIEKENYEGVVYDLQIEEDHSFSGPYLTIHNCGAGMINVCFAKFGNPIFQFSIVNSGDWIDQQAAKATGESTTFINKEKTKLDLLNPSESLVMRAIAVQYEIMLQKTVEQIKKGLTEKENVKTDKPIEIVVAGGTSLPNGFDKLLEETLIKANLPSDIQIGNVIRPKDALYSVARGCLVAAENAV